MPGLLCRCLLLLAVLVSGCTPIQGAASVSPIVTATLLPTPTVTATSTATPVASATAVPTPAPDPSALELEVVGCEGGVVLSWSASTHPQFHHYTALRSPDREIATAWPPIAPAVDWGDTYATDRFITSAVDASLIPTERRWNYRVMAYDAQGRAVASSPVRDARLFDVAELGSLDVEAGTDGVATLRWQPFSGDSACFSSYRVLYGTGGTPSTVLSVISTQEASSLDTDALRASATYRLRVEAVRSTTLGSFVVGRTDVAVYSVP